MEQEAPISRERARSAGLWAAVHLITYYGVAGLTWGLALKLSLAWSSISGATLGLVLGGLFAFPIVAKQTSEEKTKEMMFAIGATWGNLAILAGLIGLVVWILRLIFF